MKKLRPITILEAMTVLVMTAIFVAVVVQVLSRFFLETIPSWTGEEAVTFLMIWMIMMGACVAMGYSQHIVVDVLVKLMPAKIRLFLNRLTYTLLTLFLAYFAVIGFIYVWGNRNMYSPRLRIPTLIQQGCIPLGSAVMCCFAFYFLLLTFRREETTESGRVPAEEGTT